MDMSVVPIEMKPVTERGLQLLKALRKRGDWMSRADLALATGKHRLSPHDLELLNRMIAAGLVERRQRAISTPIAFAFDYRIVRIEADQQQARQNAKRSM